jgi:hypothetical protein
VAVVDERRPRHPPRFAHATFLGSDGQAPTGLVAAEGEEIAECGGHDARQSDQGHQVPQRSGSRRRQHRGPQRSVGPTLPVLAVIVTGIVDPIWLVAIEVIAAG